MKTFLFLFVAILIGVGAYFIWTRVSKSGPSASVNAMFSPQEVAIMVNKSSVDYIAGECETKKFTLFKEYYASVKSTGYRFYYPTPTYSYDETYCKASMKEKINTWDDGNFLFYIIKNKEDYLAYIDYVKQHGQQMTSELAPYASLLGDSIYLFDNCLFEDIGYNISEEGFKIRCESVKSFIAYQKAQEKQAEENERARTETIKPEVAKPETQTNSSFAYISVNVAEVFSYSYAAGHLRNESSKEIKLKKGAKIKIINREYKCYYCDFVDEDGNSNTGWIKQSDVSFTKPGS